MAQENKLTICSFLWGNWNKPYQKFYITNILKGLRKNLTIPYKFILFQDTCKKTIQIDNVEIRPLDSASWLGCLPKLNAYDPKNKFEGRVIIMDLDIVITGSLDEMFSYKGKFITRAWVKGLARGLKLSGGDLIGFEAGFGKNMFRLFKNDTEHMEEWTGGRERFVYRKLFEGKTDFWQLEYPKQFLSYKQHIMRTKNRVLPEETRLVTCHGIPRPHEIFLIDEWIKPYWSMN